MQRLNKILKILGVITVTAGVFYFGYMVGRTPTEDERQQRISDTGYTNDLYSLVGNYHNIYNLCEKKYQLGIKGDLQGAFEVKGKISALEDQIRQVESRYKITPL